MKRFLSCTPSELVGMAPAELLTAIKMSEGRIIRAAARIRGPPNLVDGISNAELAAAFGADIINIDTFNYLNPSIPGWTSKDPDVDRPFQENVQIPLGGRGFSYQEISEIVGRPLSILMFVSDPPEDVDHIERVYGKGLVATAEHMINARRAGVKHICVSGWAREESFTKLFEAVREELDNDLVIQFNRPHGPGILNQEKGFAHLITDNEIRALTRSGVDIIGIPAPGTLPGWDLDKCKKIRRINSRTRCLSKFGDSYVSRRCLFPDVGANCLIRKNGRCDMHDLGDAGYNEQMPDPLNIFHYSMAIRGRRHTYRRMAMSIKR